MLLQASVGTGKTLSLAFRVANAIKQGVNPERILCVTFTNKAAEEMGQRIDKYCPQGSNKVVTRTFHGLCAWILKQRSKQLGIPGDFSIIDEDDSQAILQEVMGIYQKELQNLNCLDFGDLIAKSHRALRPGEFYKRSGTAVSIWCK